MISHKIISVVFSAVVALLSSFGIAAAGPTTLGSNGNGPSILYLPNPSGTLKVIFTDGRFFDLTNPFFQDLGTNGRTCFSCHKPNDGWTITPPTVQAIFRATKGLDPLFNPVDGTNSPDANISSVAARKAASSMLLTKGLIRIGLSIPSGAEFTLAAVDDPYGFASASQLSLFRRPLPTTNLLFLTGVMIDSRESTGPITKTLNTTDESLYLSNLIFDLKHQADDATLGHAQASQSLSDTTLGQIVDFELHIFTAQQISAKAGSLEVKGAMGGPLDLSMERFYVTINDVLGADKFGNPFDSNAFTLFNAWANSNSSARAQILRGQQVFNDHQFDITGVGGINDDLQIPSLKGTCTTCHDSPNVGNHSVPLPINIGTSDGSRRTPDLPLYTLENKITHETVQTTDPGRALITGLWKDIGKVKGPVLRGLPARAPYFHNGSAATIEDVIEFYDDRFNIGFTQEEVEALAAFLRSL
jgi:cytochrome c peroxidase